MLEIGQDWPQVLTGIQSQSPEPSGNQEKVATMSNVPEASTPGPGGTNKPTTDHARIKTVLRSYEVVGDGHALIQKVSGVSTTFQFLAIDPCLDPSRQKTRYLLGM